MKDPIKVALILVAAWSCGCVHQQETVRLRLYAGAGLREAVEALAAAFQGETGIAVEVDYVGSGVLISRAKGDPQADLFMPGSGKSLLLKAVCGLVQVPGSPSNCVGRNTATGSRWPNRKYPSERRGRVRECARADRARGLIPIRAGPTVHYDHAV
jgi:hypothetical protein